LIERAEALHPNRAHTGLIEGQHRCSATGQPAIRRILEIHFMTIIGIDLGTCNSAAAGR